MTANRKQTSHSHVRALLLVLLPVVTLGGFERNCDYDSGSPRGICGRNLSETLALLCRMYNKRSGPAIGHSSNPLPAELVAKSPGIFMPKSHAVSLLTKRRIHGGSITCECCIHQCSLRELTSYCSVVNHKRSGGTRPLPHHYNSAASSGARMTKEQRDNAEKQTIGSEILRQGAGWWADLGHLATATDLGYGPTEEGSSFPVSPAVHEAIYQEE